MSTFAIPNGTELLKRVSEVREIGIDSLAQQVEHNTFNVGVLGSSPRRITERAAEKPLFLFYCSFILHRINFFSPAQATQGGWAPKSWP